MDLVTFTEDILNGKPHFLCSVVIKEMLDQSSVQYQSVCQPLQRMLCVPPNTSPVGRRYTYLQMIANKQRNPLSNEHLKALSLTAALKLPAKNPYEYEQEIKLAEGIV